jgi:hypothetical protein
VRQFGSAVPSMFFPGTVFAPTPAHRAPVCAGPLLAKEPTHPRWVCGLHWGGDGHLVWRYEISMASPIAWLCVITLFALFMGLFLF